MSSRGGDGGIVEGLGVVHNHSRGGIVRGGDNRGVYLVGSYNIRLLSAGVSENYSLHFGDALLKIVIAGGYIAESGAGIEVSVFVVGGNGLCLVAYDLKLARADGRGNKAVVIALANAAGLVVHNVLGLKEEVVLGEDI